jgi:hypothetical protein
VEFLVQDRVIVPHQRILDVLLVVWANVLVQAVVVIIVILISLLTSGVITDIVPVVIELPVNVYPIVVVLVRMQENALLAHVVSVVLNSDVSGLVPQLVLPILTVLPMWMVVQSVQLVSVKDPLDVLHIVFLIRIVFKIQMDVLNV